MRARAVIGSSFGDEGKGLLVYYLCAKHSPDVVVRFNGGAQAGHTVVTPDLRRHVFSHFGSGTFVGVPTFLSQYFVVNPIMFLDELKELQPKGPSPTVFAHPSCIVTTFADMIINQRLENKLGTKRHGSCGLGVNETMLRSNLPHLNITMADLWNGVDLRAKLKEICTTYAEYRSGSHIDQHYMLTEEFMRRAEAVAGYLIPGGMGTFKDTLFEGAQGLLLDQNNKAFFPHLTRSNTGMKNVRALCAQAGIDDIEVTYVSRTYLTRHGAGPLPGEDPAMRFDDDTNLIHPYQGTLRFAPLDADLYRRIKEDARESPYNIAMTHADQLAPPSSPAYVSFGPTRDDVQSNLIIGPLKGSRRAS